jgi:hypothetical protein
MALAHGLMYYCFLPESKPILRHAVFFSEMSKYIPEGGLDPATFQSVMDAANIKYYLAKVR